MVVCAGVGRGFLLGGIQAKFQRPQTLRRGFRVFMRMNRFSGGEGSVYLSKAGSNQVSDIAEFAVAAIRRWWSRLGRRKYGTAKRLLITADSGGSNSSRSRLWKLELQKFADKTGLIIEVCHYPPGTSKWNKIEHSVFCHITRNWRGVPLETLEIVLESIGNTKTETGLEVHVWLDERIYEKGRNVSDVELAECLLKRNTFHGDWNYEIHPRP
jgi:hypothetical protein